MNKLCNLIKKLDELYNINKGGCAYIAYVLCTKFENEGKDYQVCCNIGECKLKPHMNENVKHMVCVKGKLKDIDCRLYCGWWTPIHFFIKSNGIEYNKWNVTEYEVLDLNSEKLLEIYNNGRWNKTFDKTNLNEIKQMILKC